ncbi:MAG: RNA methyltransferase [Planctomycetes bacterium]|nr:RNA methyltransferase [Planctomycetota bacterium]
MAGSCQTLAPEPQNRQDARMQPVEPKTITSTKNPILQLFRAAATGDDAGAMLAEGVRLATEGLDAGLKVLAALVSPRMRDEHLAERLRALPEYATCSDEILAKVSSLETHQGVAVVFARPSWAPLDLLRADPSPIVVAAAGVRDPGNLGALIRTAEAAGASGFVALAGSADPFREKAVRGAMGSSFRLATSAGVKPQELIEFCRKQKLQLVVADGGGERSYLDIDWRKPSMLVVGAEAAGVPAELIKAADARVRIPITKAVDSLNVAVAAGVLLFEARRQRR